VWNCVGCQLLFGWSNWGKDIGRVCGMSAEEKCVKCFMGKPERKRMFEELRYRWQEKIISDLKGTVWKTIDWINLDQGMEQCQAFVKILMNLQIRQHVGNFLPSWEIIICQIRTLPSRASCLCEIWGSGTSIYTVYWNVTLNVHVRRTWRMCSMLRMEVVYSSKHWYVKKLYIFAFQWIFRDLLMKYYLY